MEAIWDHAARHHGVVSLAEAAALGLTRTQIDNSIRAGRLRRVAPRVYIVAGSPSTWHQRARVAALSSCGVVSHKAAAALHGIDGYRLAAIEVVVPKSRRPRIEGFTIHRSTQFHLADEIEIEAIPTTGLPRTVIDLAAVVSPRRFEWALDAVLRQKLCDWTDLFSVLQCHSIQGRNGCGPLRALLEVRDPDDPIPDSAWNRMVGQLLEAAGLPTPAYEFEIRDGATFVARVDLAYPDRKIAVELDSIQWHLNRESFEKDPRRKNQLIAAGWTVLSFTWADYRDRPHQIVRLVRDLLNKAA